MASRRGDERDQRGRPVERFDAVMSVRRLRSRPGRCGVDVTVSRRPCEVTHLLAGHADASTGRRECLTLVIAFEPFPILIGVLLLTSKRGRPKAVGYLAGWALALATIGVTIVLVGGQVSASSGTSSTRFSRGGRPRHVTGQVNRQQD
jgi:hypothetical protein